MQSRHKVLILDDNPELLELYKEMLSQLPSRPEVHTATAGSRALALLDAQPFRLLLCDLKMPKMDGLQVLSIVRRRFPELRTVVITAVEDEEFRSRAYALGVDLFWLKPDTHKNMQMFLECLEALLGRDSEGGFRGVQSKSLMDIVQMECLSQSSTVMRITRGALVGKLWIQNGELIDAEAEGARGEAAFRRILEWKSGTFENLPAEPDRERTIHKSVNALLLETAQAMDEVSGSDNDPEDAEHRKTVWRLSALTREGAEWVVSLGESGPAEGWGTHSAEELGKWMRVLEEACHRMSDRIEAGPLSNVQAAGLDRRLVYLPSSGKSMLVAWPLDTDRASALEKTKKLTATWDS
ncbi:MAG TPA: response regulator [Verrucomicrobia bacterium]|nr:response regulator [Verrucomicrobiota bacterium]HOB32855.1 response regulator [Verrucomicrobiota bacterium]HOP95885.1 response regulator [Verrucomicrobiota bacterium]HPU56903.1 response regulator [Verrucomicrobiota bacterium]